MNRITVITLCVGLLIFNMHSASAQSARAFERANCNASFLNNCDDGGDANISSAPAPFLGGAGAVGGLIAVALISRRTRCSKNKGPKK